MSRRILTINVAMAALLVTACASTPPPPPPPPPPEPPESRPVHPVQKVIPRAELIASEGGVSTIPAGNPARQLSANPPPLCPDQAACVVPAAVGVGRQPNTGSEWIRRSTEPMAWHAADEHCASKGGGWRLPTYAELDTLFNVNISERAECGDLTCRISGLFTLAAPAVWTSGRYRPTEMVAMDLNLGTVRPLEEQDSERAVAVCVKR